MLLACSLVAAVAIAAGCGGAPSVTPEARESGAPAASLASPSASAEPQLKPSTRGKTPKPKPSKSAKAARSSGSAARGPAKIVFVNVGQGDAAIIKSGSWAGLIDGGPSDSEGAIKAELRRLGISRLSAVVISHPHADHTGGLSGVVYDYRPKQAFVGQGAGSAAAALRAVGARIVKVRRGATLRFGSVKAKVLSPGSISGDANKDSVVLLLEAGGRCFLFTGDCTGANESLVGSICARGPPLYVLKVAHHGSRYSTSSSFLADTDPKFAVISVGPNSYGHPASETVAALKAQGTRIYSTQKNGTVTLSVAASGSVAWSFARSSKPLTRAGGGSGSGGGSSGSATGTSGGGAKVYVTKTGECYHRGGCRYLSQSKLPISLKDAKKRGYRPCSVCRPPN